MTDRIDTAAEREKLAALDGYTPGPWEPSFGEAYRVRSDGMNIATAHFVTLLDRIPTKQVAANARLIAAAPDLLATLAAALDEIERLRATLSAITATDCYSREEVTNMARAALKGADQ